MHHFRPEVELRIFEFRAVNSAVGFGGLASAADDSLALPDSLGLRLSEPKHHSQPCWSDTLSSRVKVLWLAK